MKVTAIILLSACITASATGYTQKVSLSENNVPLEKVFKEIKKQTGFSFFFNEDLLTKATKVTVRVKDVSLQEALEICFKGQPLTYSIIGNTIVVEEIKKVITDEQLNLPPPIIDIKGRIINENGEPVAASITVKGTQKGSTSNTDGYFELKGVDENATLVITATNIETQEIKVNGKTDLGTISVKIKVSPIDEIQVIGFGTINRRYGTGSVSVVSAKQIETQPVSNILQTLQGQVPGLNIISPNGMPGSRSLAQIRGQNTLANKAENVLTTFDQPLILVDGVPLPLQNQSLMGNTFASAAGASYWQQFSSGLSSLNGINPLDIESVSVLKDADATSIYGSQGSNGVILITTKRAKAGKDVLNISFNSGFNKASRLTPMLNTRQYLDMRNEALTLTGVAANQFADPDLLIFDQERQINWMKEFYGGTSRRTDLHVSLSGGSLSTTYLVSGGFTKETYNFPGDMSNTRYSIHSAFNHKSKNQKFKVDFVTDFSYGDNTASGEPGALIGFTLAPNFPDLLDADGKPVWSYKGYTYGGYQHNPLAAVQRKAKNESYQLNTNLLLSYEILTNLKLSVNAGYGRTSETFYSALPKGTQNPAYMPTGRASFGNRNTDVINIVPQIDYNKSIGKGLLTAMAGGTYKRNYLFGTTVNGYGYTSDALMNSIAGASSIDAANTGSYYKYAGVFGRVNFRWDNKYIINLTGNRDGSSNFGPDKQFGSFGSVGAGWILSEENWLKNFSPVLSFVKLSANYGTSGSDGVAPYQYQSNWRRAGSNTYQGLPGYNPINPLNPEYAWASNKKFTQQIDLGFFADRLLINFGLYQNRSNNQLVSYLQPIQTGFPSIVTNAPYEVTNNGWEVTISTNNVTRKDFRWTTSMNLSQNHNKLASFPDIASSPYASYYVVGQSLFAKQLVPFAGVNAQTGLFEFYKADGTKSSLINNASGFNKVGGDLTQLLELMPKLQGGLTNTITWKTLTFSFLLQFCVQDGPNYLRNIYSGPGMIPGTPLVNQPVALLDGLWHKPGDVAITQRLNSGFSGANGFNVYLAGNAFTSSTGAYSDASYIRMKNVSLSYSLPEKWTKRLFMKGCSLYGNAQNLFLITGYKVGDPETLNIYTIPPQRTVVLGINVNL
jgi:TonB-linked SusC/RagA family outer membrane protein